MTIIGQDKLLNKINKLTLDTLPHTIMLCGELGSGRHLIVNYVAEKFNLTTINISDKLTYETIEEITLKVEPNIYIIEASGLTNKNENAILKFLEEPLKNAFIFIITETKWDLIETIRNRCHIWQMATYSSEIIESFINKESEFASLLLSICKTPGDVIAMQSYPIKNMIVLADKIFDKIGIANYANILTLSKQIAFKNEKDKFDFHLFTRLLVYVAKQRVYKNTLNCFSQYTCTLEFVNKSKIKHIAKQELFENFLLNLKKVSVS